MEFYDFIFNFNNEYEYTCNDCKNFELDKICWVEGYCKIKLNKNKFPITTRRYNKRCENFKCI